MKKGKRLFTLPTKLSAEPTTPENNLCSVGLPGSDKEWRSEVMSPFKISLRFPRRIVEYSNEGNTYV